MPVHPTDLDPCKSGHGKNMEGFNTLLTVIMTIAVSVSKHCELTLVKSFLCVISFSAP